MIRPKNGDSPYHDSTLMLIGNKKSFVFNSTVELDYFKAKPMKQKFQKDYKDEGLMVVQIPYDQIEDTTCT